MTNIPVEAGKPLVIGNLKVEVVRDHVTLTDTNIEIKTEDAGTFKSTEIKTLTLADRKITLDQSKASSFEDTPGHGVGKSASTHGTIMSMIPFTLTKEIRDAYARAVADGVIDDAEQAQFKALEQELVKLDYHLTDESLQPLITKAQAIARDNSNGK